MEGAIENSLRGMSDDLKRRLDIVKYKAKYAEVGSMFFIEVSSLPLVSVLVVTGQEDKLDKNSKQVHLTYVPQPENYPPTFDGGLELESIGYKRYLQENKDTQIMSLKHYQHKVVNLCNNINASIQKNHGVKCYDNEEKKKNGDCFYLHICDIFNVMVCNLSEDKIEVVVRSDLLTDVCDEMTNEFETLYLQASDRKFLVDNIDLFYYCYGYLGNNSFVPIRTKVPSNSIYFLHSSFFTNNDHFISHQIGKMHEINQNGCGLKSKQAYRSI